MHNLLILGGGGVRGQLSNQVLKYIERRTGRPICESFQGVYGTSTGAIQAAALTCPKPLSAVALEAMYETLCSRVFDRRALSLGGWAGPMYSADILNQELSNVLATARLMDTRTQFGCVTYDLHERAPYLLTSYATGQLWTRVDACRASAAAPTFFPPFKDRWIDGGLVANLPAAWAAIDYARHFRVPFSEIRILAVGTGTTEAPIKDAGSRGKLGWVEDVIDIGMSGSQDLEEIMCQSLGLRDFLQLQIALPAEHAAMDDCSKENLKRLKQYGNQMVGQDLSKINDFLDRSADRA